MESKNLNQISIDIPNYNGPLEVLLELAKTQKVDLAEISITKLADQFLEFIKKHEDLNLETASEFLLMATWLAYLKSKLLLPESEDDDFKALEVAEKLVSLGYFISFSGNITYKNSHLPQVARKVPLHRLLIETDCPFLSPHPHRGKTNEPSRVRLVAEKLAEIHSMPLNRMAEVTSKNAEKIFGV